MRLNNLLKIHKESVVLLFQGSMKAIPFNVVLALLLAVELIYNNVPLLVVILWLSGICIISCIRWVFCDGVIAKGFDNSKIRSVLIIFFILTFLTGVAWSCCYPIAISYLNETNEFIVILVFGGMSAGAIASLSVWLPAYLSYILPIFLPVIFYNISLFTVNSGILAVMFTLFVLMVIITATLNNQLLNQTFQLSREKEALIQKLKVLSTTDVLTGLYNRRYFEEALLKEFNRGKRNKYTLNLVSIDVDNFKLANDNFGHLYGDKFITYVAQLLRQILSRSNDTVFRLGGDEFAAILVNISAQEVFEICKKIQKQFADKVDVPNSNHVNQNEILNRITLSIGVASMPFDGLSTVDNVVMVADRALYQSKLQGKNQIILSEIS